MPKRYPSEFRRAVCKRLVAGEKVSSLRKELGVSEATLYLWKHQALIDADLAIGLKSFEADELAQAYKTIAELEAELEAVKAASELPPPWRTPNVRRRESSLGRMSLCQCVIQTSSANVPSSWPERATNRSLTSRPISASPPRACVGG